ncbi:MAG: heme exporter protein CcmB [Thermoanaerobaculia bacterium]
MSSAWIAEAGALFAKEWRTELRGRHAISTLALFAVTTLVVLSLALGPVGVSREDRTWVAPVVLWILLLFSASLGLPRSFVREEESRTAIALRLAATPSALFAGKLLYTLTLLFALELLVAPLFLAALQIEVARWGLFGLALGLGGAGLAAASTLVAAIAAQGEGKTTLFSVLALPVLVPLLLLAITLTRAAFEPTGLPDGILLQLVLYDGTVVVAGFMLFPAVWNP